MVVRATALLVCLTVCSVQFVLGQKVKAALPMVAGASVPLYPPIARAARVEGVVRLLVSTDGQRVAATHVEDGHKLLAAAAEENVRTWSFSTHEATSFVVTYRYRLLRLGSHTGADNPTIVLKLPTEVEISIPRLPPLD